MTAIGFLCDVSPAEAETGQIAGKPRDLSSIPDTIARRRGPNSEVPHDRTDAEYVQAQIEVGARQFSALRADLERAAAILPRLMRKLSSRRRSTAERDDDLTIRSGKAELGDVSFRFTIQA